MAFLWYRTVTIDKTKVPNTDRTNFAVLVSGTYTYLKTTGNGGDVTNASGFDIGFYSDSGLTTKLDWEIERYVATTGEVVFWVRLATVSTATDTVFYMAYANSAITTDQSNKTGVWDANYKLVQHLGDGTTLSLADSTGVYSSVNNGATAAVGKIDGGVAESGSSQYYSVTNGGNIISGLNAWTVEIWVKGVTFTAQPIIWCMHVAGGSIDVGLESSATGTTLFWFCRGGGTPTRVVNADISDGAWHHIACVKTSTGDNGNLYIDGVLATVASGVIESTPNPTNIAMQVGAYNGGLTWNGSLDEFRISTSIRSADHLKTVVNNASPSTFYTVGSAVAVGAAALPRAPVILRQAVNRASAY